MLFNSTEFLIFFPIVLIIYFIVPRKVRYIWLLIASYYFYMSLNPQYLILLIVLTLLTYFTGIFMEKGTPKAKKCCMVVCLIVSLGILCVFKYSGFVIDSINDILTGLHMQPVAAVFNPILPVGISFYTFQAVGYMLDVYRGNGKAERNIAKYALFVSFFPNILSGPIERGKNILPQIDGLKDQKLWDYDRITSGAVLMLWGYFQKMVIADRVALLVNEVYDNYRIHGAVAIIVATLFFSVQVYCDFASYSNMAIGAARIMGIDLMRNFETPYFAKSVGEFWRRWHISLSTWFKDYLYIPLGGNRCSKIRHYFNLMVVFLVSGLWHGASWGYVVWGALHGAYQVIGIQTKALRNRIAEKLQFKTESFSYKLMQVGMTFSMVGFAWIFFRAEDVGQAGGMISRLFTRWDPWTLFDESVYTWGLERKEFWIAVFAVMVLLVVDLVRRIKKQDIIQMLNTQCIWFRWGLYLLLLFAVVILGYYGPTYDPQAFLYFAF